ncbi:MULTISPECIES: phytanoyl-CoA dioxygenase family protein [unclassified Sphingomonas]|uniref:phytanoyl-CoA dioxygenase family protein n=1 Tax=unclassified Sphingomonas TaxID=196159 RepID=UPI0006FDE96E|nr:MULTISPECIES: phytanoyl-CoA dioxygenase family protein [unclassified Sphingomonas]KQM98849.1 phytanoyl-CoA dioxygenase [Sphingomonas sp. Leaf25]KQN40486.1 phytanoyl-CoA dioxygenase [Sphingomonas sp. Leaf42]KQT29840.1 phytanoyl-CoA dioxygenase [Sphingomonas sp. Leaf407]
MTPDLDRDGARHLPGAAATAVTAIEAALAHVPPERAGVRLHGIGALSDLLSGTGAIGRLAAAVLGHRTRPVRALLFDKTADTNWALGWHQDRTIVVARRHDIPGYGPWTVKQGLQHVAPPPDLLAAMVTMRVHLDPVPGTNAPLLVAGGSHRLGRIAEGDIPAIVAASPRFVCTADRGDVWLYSTPILHASDAAAHPSRRRVLQVDYAACDLPGGLRWAGV